MAMYKKSNQIQQDSTQTSPLNDQNKLQWNNNQKTIMLPQIHVRIHIQKGQNQDDKGKQQFKR